MIIPTFAAEPTASEVESEDDLNSFRGADAPAEFDNFNQTSNIFQRSETLIEQDVKGVQYFPWNSSSIYRQSPIFSLVTKNTF